MECVNQLFCCRIFIEIDTYCPTIFHDFYKVIKIFGSMFITFFYIVIKVIRHNRTFIFYRFNVFRVDTRKENSVGNIILFCQIVNNMKIIITKQLLDKFIQEGCLSKEEAFIMRTRIEGWSRQEQAAALNTSLSSIDRRIKRLKKVYDEVQKNNPEFPKRLEK